MAVITEVKAREVLDSRGNPTVEVEVVTASGFTGRAIVPSGASTGKNEALELRDGERESLFGPKGVSEAVKNVERVAEGLIGGFSVLEQAEIDSYLIKSDGSPNKSKLGANAILAISLAVARAAASYLGISLFKYIGGPNARTLPVPMLNVINGGAHASNTLDFQEFMILPHGFKSFKLALAAAYKIFHKLASLLTKRGYGTLVGDEGGFAPNLSSHEEALDLLVEAIREAGFKPSMEAEEGAVAIAIDAAASEFYDEASQRYIFKKLKAAGGQSSSATEFNREGLLAYYEHLFKSYPIISVEDGFAEGDMLGFKLFTERVGGKHQVVGDDLTVTNPLFIKRAIEEGAINSVLIKLNQIGSLTETLDAISLCQKANYTAIISHRSGESEDTFIADLAVATNSGLIKTGSLSRTDRVAKYNQLLRIEEELGDTAIFPGTAAFYNLKG